MKVTATATLFAVVAADTCSLYEIADGSCGQSDLDCSYTKYAKAAEKALQDGTCADQGYTTKTGTQTKSYPVIGDIVISTYDKPALESGDTCSLYEIADGSCGQSDLDCSYTKYAKAAEKALQDGTCADQGYTTKTGTQTKSYPVIGDIVISTYDKPALQSAVSAVEGHYEGSVPFIIDINMIFGATTVDTDLNIKVASQEIKCPTQAFAQTASLVSFPNIAADGDCLGDALRTQGKDTSKYALDINSDGSLNFRTDGYPDMKMKKKSLMAEADICSLYEIADGSCGQSDLKCSYTKYAKAAEKALQDGTCADQGYTTKTGTQTKSYPVIGDIVISTYDKPALQSAVSAVAGHYEGSVPFIIDINMIFGATTVDTDLNIKVASQEIKCPTQAFAQTASLVSFPNIAADGDCLGDALRTQGKDTSKYALDINSDGSLNFRTDGYPDMKMKKKSADMFLV